MSPFLEPTRHKDLLAGAIVWTCVVAIFLALGWFWRSAISVVAATAFWYQVWKTAKKIRPPRPSVCAPRTLMPSPRRSLLRRGLGRIPVTSH